MSNVEGQPSSLVAAMADGIGDLVFASSEWVSVASEVVAVQAMRRAAGLESMGRFALCEVAHNPPAYLHHEGPLAWHAIFEGSSVQMRSGELPDDECDFKMQGDHSIISNLARLQYRGHDPVTVAAARERLMKLSRWEVQGGLPSNPALGGLLRELHDAMAARTMPRFWFMTPEWVTSARHILTERSLMEKYAAAIADVDFTFSEEFTDTPAYAFPDGSHGGFWVKCDQGHLTVGAGPLPAELGPADVLTKGAYTPVVPVGRTVNAALSPEDVEEQKSYSKAAFRPDAAGTPPVSQTSPTGRQMPPSLSRIFVPLHDELSKRTSGELPADFDSSLKAEWSAPPAFDRNPSYDASWTRYGEVDVFGNPR